MAQVRLEPGTVEMQPLKHAQGNLLVCAPGEHELYFTHVCSNFLFEIFVVNGARVSIKSRDGIEFSDGKSKQTESLLTEQKIHRVLGGNDVHMTDFPLVSPPAARQAKVSKSQEADEG